MESLLDEVGVAVVGAGAWGQNHVRVWDSLRALRLVCDADASRVGAVGARYPSVPTTTSIDEVLRRDDVRGVVVASPAVTHYDLTLRALQAGKDVLVEKPMAMSVSQAQHLRDEARHRGAVLAVGHVIEYHPAILELRRLIGEGELGELRYLYAHRLNLGRVRVEENALWSFAPHDVALILRLTGALPLQVTCTGGAYLSQDVADVTLMSMTFATGVMAHVFVSWLHPFKVHRFVVVGSHQMAVFDDTEPWSTKLLLYPHRFDVIEGEPPIARRAEANAIALEEREPLMVECEQFAHALVSRSQVLTDAQTGVDVLRVLEEAQASMVASPEAGRAG